MGVQVPEKDAAFELVEREVPTPGRGEVVVRVHACGVCHSDSMAGVRPRIETMPLERAEEVHDRMMAGDARFRMVLTTGA